MPGLEFERLDAGFGELVRKLLARRNPRLSMMTTR